MAALDAALLPYSLLVGQERLKRALELSHVAPSIGGVLVSGHRGTGKSTAVRAYAWMLHGALPVTLPINATDDRIVGGWKLDELMVNQRPVPQPGLLVQASERGMLYIDEVNLLDDHIVNLILDVSSTGQLSVQYEAQDEQVQVSFALVGTMNPEEGWLRPQLLDRFGLMVDVHEEQTPERRAAVLSTVLRFDEARTNGTGDAYAWVEAGRRQDAEEKQRLAAARARLYDVAVSDDIVEACASLAARFQAAGHRGDYVMALGARAEASIAGDDEVRLEHVRAVARMALQHRRPVTTEGGQIDWSAADDELVAETLAGR